MKHKNSDIVQIKVRINGLWHTRLVAQAKRNGISLNREICERLRQSFATELLLKALKT